MQAFRYEKGGGIAIKKLIQRLWRLEGDLFIALGLGILMGTILMNISYKAKTQFNVETEARKLGMIYPSEVKVLDNN